MPEHDHDKPAPPGAGHATAARGSGPAAGEVPLAARVRIGYGLGSFATGTFGTVPGLLLLYYLTDILGVTAGLAGLLVFLPKAWDVLLNPWIGSLSDRTAHRWGPRRPLMLLGALTMPLCFAAMFAAPDLERGWAAAYVAVLFLLTATGYACFQVPYVALPAELTTDPDERARVMSWRVAFLGAAILLSGAVAPLLAGASGDDHGSPGGYRLMGVVIGALLCAGMLAAFAATARAPAVLRVTSEPGLLAQLRAARGNRPFARLLAAFVTQAAATGLMLAGTQYFATYILHRPSATSVLFACLIVPSLLAMPLWLTVGRRTGKRSAALAASGCFLAGAATAAFARELPAGAVYAAVALAGAGYAGMQMLPLAMLGDAIAADAFTSGRRRAGLFTGLWTAGETLGLALGPGLYGLVLAAGGFVSSDAGHRVEQPASALTAIVTGFGALPALLLLLSLPMLARYDLTERKLNALRDAAARRAPAPAAGTAPDPRPADPRRDGDIP
ncbi:MULTISPECIES: MFS transporter [Streptomyces]|uniref:MFS transporter n=1 Tax=Streptomyces xinghaiensis TaxID=1038928 RepID=A0A3S5ILB3_9ACTN|nr:MULTISPECIES: MFS transporter [Streptomyces]PQM22403.1 MFS transporter [Streptomyces xinghaiensis]RKM96630.1 MFS transporter [Streptomyces xinghaiensis]RNC74218.1 MFS transporter [Streptomyces xinghaiensis]